MTGDLTAEQIVAYACREGFRRVVTEHMVTAAIATLRSPFTCRDVVVAIGPDEQGSTVSEYLVALWIEDFIGRGRLRWTGARLPRTYEATS